MKILYLITFKPIPLINDIHRIKVRYLLFTDEEKNLKFTEVTIFQKPPLVVIRNHEGYGAGHSLIIILPARVTHTGYKNSSRKFANPVMEECADAPQPGFDRV